MIFFWSCKFQWNKATFALFPKAFCSATKKNSNGPGRWNFSHTPGRADKLTSNKDRTSYRGAVSTLTSISHSWIFVSFLVVSSPRSYLFTSGTGWVGIHTAPRYGTNPVRYKTLHFRNRRGAASLRHWNRAPQPFLCVNRSSISGMISVAAQKLLSGKVWTYHMIHVCKLVSSLIEMLRYCDVSPVLYRFAMSVSKFVVWSVQCILLLCLGCSWIFDIVSCK